MNRIFCLCIFLLISFFVKGQEMSFGKISITPYITEKSGLNATTERLMETKLNQIVSVNNAVGGFDKRFIITPIVNVFSVSETSTIPQKTSMKVSVTFYVGDGIDGVLFNSHNIELVGIGDNHNGALYSAIRKINVKDSGLQELLSVAKKRIVEYYNTIAPTLLDKAEGYIATSDYEKALASLAVIPSLCQSYSKAQSLISYCGGKILEEKNNTLLAKAKIAWSASPNEKGANEASIYLSQIVVSSSFYKTEIDKLTKQIQQRLIQIEDKQIEFEEVKLLSEERLEIERINASANVTSSFINTLAELAFNVFKWF